MGRAKRVTNSPGREVNQSGRIADNLTMERETVGGGWSVFGTVERDSTLAASPVVHHINEQPIKINEQPIEERRSRPKGRRSTDHIDDDTATGHGSPHLPAIDGLRGLAVLAVVAYHFDLHLPGGFLGVDLFFVVSGFVVARALLNDAGSHKPTGEILRSFVRRRFWRLWPTLAAMVAASVAISWALAATGNSPDSGPKQVAKHGVAALFGVANWFHLATANDHAEQFRPLLHTWSLSIEEQFYLVLALLLVVGRRAARRLSFVVAGFGFAMSALMCLKSSGDPERIFFGTDTRAAPLALGVGLAGASLLWSRQLAQHASLVNRVGLFSGAFVLGALLSAQWDSRQSTWMFVVLAIPFAMLVAGAAHGEGALPKFLKHPWLQSVGLRSYSIYLWHFPVVGWLANSPTPIRLIVATIFTVALSEASYRWVERPMRARGRDSRGETARLNVPVPR